MRKCCMSFILISWLCRLGTNAATTGHVKLLMVSRNHFKAEKDGYYECHLSSPDTDAIVDSARDAWTLNNEDRNQLSSFPGPPLYVSTDGYSHYKVELPNNQKNDSFGIFSCIATKPGKQITSVSTPRMRSDALVVPQDELLTQTVSVGDSGVSIRMKRLDHHSSVGLRWRINNVDVCKNDNEEVFFFPKKIDAKDRGVYECHWYYNTIQTLSKRTRGKYTYRTECKYNTRGSIKWNLHGLQILIVRACPANTWGPPECNYLCDICYNGGVCEENRGSCVCPPGFKGEDCSIACGGNRFGYDCEKKCNMTHDHSDQCRGLLFCLNHPYGCRCNTGWKGLDCETPCDESTYGANCLQRCNCSEDEHCSRYMGCRVLPELLSAPTVVIKGNSSITISWSEWDETKDIGDPPVIGYIPYYKGKVGSSWIQGDLVSSGPRQFTAINLFPETIYLFSVAAVREGGRGEGPKGPSLEVETFCDTPNIKPTNLQCLVQGYHQEVVNISWTVPGLSKINCKTGIELFTIYVASSSGVQSHEVHDPDARWFNIEILEPGRYYRFEMTLSTTGGESSVSEESDMSTIFLPVLPRLSGTPFFINVTSHSVTIGWLEWNSLTDVGTPFVVAYKPYFKLSNASKWINGSLVLFHEICEYTFDGLLPDKFYDFSVAAFRDGFGGEGPKSPFAKIKVHKKDFCESSGIGQRGRFTSAFTVVVILLTTYILRKRKILKPSQVHQGTSTSDLLQTKDQGTETSDFVDANIRKEEESQKCSKTDNNRY